MRWMQDKSIVKTGYKFTDEINQKLLFLKSEFDRLRPGSPERDQNIEERKRLLGL